MKLDRFRRRLDALVPIKDCPCCHALESMDEATIDRNLSLIEQGISTLPGPSPTCPTCQRYVGMSEEEIDARIIKLNEFLEVT